MPGGGIIKLSNYQIIDQSNQEIKKLQAHWFDEKASGGGFHGDVYAFLQGV